MRRRSHPESSTPPEFVPVAHPSLKAALSSLDVQLDEELSRYRRLRAIQQKQLSERQRRKPSSHATNSSQHLLSGDLSANLDASELREPAHGLSAHLLDRLSERGATSDSSLYQVAPLDALAIAPSHALDVAANGSDLGSHLASDGVDSEYATIDSNYEASYRHHSALDSSHEISPDDYLASSEELLRSLDEVDHQSDDIQDYDEDARFADQQPGILASLLTPLGVGSMLLLLISSATLGYLVTHSSSLGLWTWGDRPSESAQSGQDGALDLATAPDLSAGEFQDLNLNNLSTLPNGSSDSGQIPPILDPSALRDGRALVDSANPAASLPSVDVPSDQESAPAVRPSAPDPAPASAVPRSSVSRPASAAAPSQPTTNPSAAASPSPAVAPAPAPAPAPSRVAAASSGNSSSNYYYVVTNYTGDRSLTQAREAVSGAYVRNFPEGARVQLGAFSEAGRAEELANQLRQQGISAEIYQR